MSDKILKEYLDAWSVHCCGGSDAADRMVAASHPDIRYADINMPTAASGHDGIRGICKMASEMLPGAILNYSALLTDGRNWSMHWELKGKFGDKSYLCHGASTGVVAADGRVIEQVDYWNPAHLQN